MRRRKLLIALGGGLTLAWPHFSRAQRPTMPIIGFLYSRSRTGVAIPGAPFRQALAEAGYAEGRNLIFEYRSAEGNYDRLPDLAADLVQQPAAIIVALDLVCSRAAKAATSTIPIVFWSGGDPVHDGLVASLNRPGRNLTGVSMFNNVLGAKRLELLRELIPKATVFAILVNPANPNAEPQAKDAQEAARSKGVQLHVVRASTASDIEGAFDKLVNLRAEGLIVSADSYLASMKDRLVALAARHSIPTIYTIPSYAAAGGLISYTSSALMDYELGNYTARILRGEKPAELPVLRPARFQMVINLKTAAALGLAVPQSLVALADEVIE